MPIVYLCRMKAGIPIYAIETLTSYKKKGVLVSRFRYYLQQQQNLLWPHRHHFYHLVYFTEGRGSQQLDFNTFDIKKGQIYFMIPGQVHHWKFDEEPDGYLINFSADYFNSFLLDPAYLSRFRFFSGETGLQVIDLPDASREKLEWIFEEILKEVSNEAFKDDDLVKVLLLRIFMEVAHIQQAERPLLENAYNHTLIRNFKALIAQHYKTLKLPKQYAALLYITPNHLNAVCQDFLGVSAGSLIRSRILLEAKRLLIYPDMRISEIAAELQFADQSYFVKFFKKYEGITPEKFRKSIIDGNGTKTIDPMAGAGTC